MHVGQNKRKQILIISFITVLFVALVLFVLLKQPAPTDEAEQALAGKALTEKYCQSCHVLPEPGLLDKANWKKLLPEMGYRLGIHSPEVSVPAEDLSFYPTHAAVNPAEWQTILNYYQALAPASLPDQTKSVVPQGAVPFFSALLPPEDLFSSNTVVTCIKMDNSVQPGRLFIYDAASHKLLLFNRYGLMDAIYTEDVIIDLKFYRNEMYACSIGKTLSIGTVNNKFGKVFPITVSKAGKIKIEKPLIEGLARPVNVVPTDVNNDGKTDFIVCEFGSLRGALSWFKNNGNGKFQQQLLRSESGSVNVLTKINKQTGLQDLWVLFAQGEEGIFHFKNKGKGEFKMEQVLRFPPTYGSTSFVMEDVNNDGHEDIVYTCGDNGDVTAVLKPYHGVYVFLNDGQNHFHQQFFYAMHGCYKVIAKDFRNTGRIDLAAIAYFTDAQKPEAFVFLQNNGNGNYTAFNPPAEINFESILTMDSGDFNGDGKQDIFIGNALTDKAFKGSPFAILANGSE